MSAETPITASFVLTPDEIKAFRAAYFERPQESKTIAIVAIVLGVAGLAYGVLSGWIRVNRAAWDLRSIVITVITVLLLYLYFRWQRRSAERKAITEDPTTNRRIVLQFSPDAILSKIEGLSETSFLWSSVIRVRRAGGDLLLYQGVRVCIWVPEHAFASKADADAVAALAKERVSNYSER